MGRYVIRLHYYDVANFSFSSRKVLLRFRRLMGHCLDYWTGINWDRHEICASVLVLLFWFGCSILSHSFIHCTIKHQLCAPTISSANPSLCIQRRGTPPSFPTKRAPSYTVVVLPVFNAENPHLHLLFQQRSSRRALLYIKSICTFDVLSYFLVLTY